MKLFSPAALVLTLTLLAVACGGDRPAATPSQEPSPATSSIVAPRPTSTTMPTMAPVPAPTSMVGPIPSGEHGGRLTTIAQANIPHLDVHQEVQETLTSLGPGLAYSRLLRLRTGPEDERPQPSLLLECDLCESWEALDALTYSFKLREGVLWHDVPPVSGREMVADDVAYSLERLRTPGWPNAALLQNIDRITAEGPYTVNVTLKPSFPDADFMVSLADGHAKVVAPELVKQEGDLKAAPVIGTGPWKLVSAVEDEGALLERNPEYFEDGLPFFDELSIRIIKGSDETRLLAFGTGLVDVYRVPPGFQKDLDGSAADFGSFLSKRGGSGIALTMNTSVPPFDDVQVRRAVLLALEPWNDLDDTWSGQGYIGVGIPVENPEWLLSNEEMGSYFADQESAKDMLSSIATDGPISFDLHVGDFGDIHLDYGRKIAADLRSVGFDTDPNPRFLNPLQYRKVVWDQGDYQIALGQLPPTNTTNSYLLNILHSRSRTNPVKHSDSILDELILDQATETDTSVRGEAIRMVQRRVLEQAYMVTTVTDGDMWVFGPKIKGFYPNSAASEYFFWAKAWSGS